MTDRDPAAFGPKIDPECSRPPACWERGRPVRIPAKLRFPGK